MSIYLSLEAQEALLSCQRVIFIITSVLNVISMRCLIKETPKNQSSIKGYLIFIQVIVVLSSVYLDVLFAPIPTFPALAGYCIGLLCMAGVSLNSVLGVFVLLLMFVGLSITSCIFYRHQSIIPANSLLRVHPKFRIVVQLIFAMILSTFALAYILFPFECTDILRILQENPFNITWISTRGPFLTHDRNSYALAAINIVNVDLVANTAVVLAMFLHMLHVLSAETNRSPSTVKIIRKSLIILFVQIAVPVFLIVIPAFLLFTSLACDCIPFEVTLPSYCVLTLHPFVHNIILLSITPAYRKYVMSSIMRGLKPKVSAQSVTMMI